MPDAAIAAIEAKYVAHDWLRLSANVAQCKRCNVFWVEDEYGPTSKFYEDEGVELANMPHCAWQEA